MTCTGVRLAAVFKWNVNRPDPVISDVIRPKVTNPYAPTQATEAAPRTPACRRPRTYFDAALIGCGISCIAPVGNSIYCTLFLDMPLLNTLQMLVVRMLPTALLCVVAGLILSTLVPSAVSRVSAHYQMSIPAIVNSLLFSSYFSMLGFGYVRGSIVVAGYTVTHYVLLPAMIAGIATLLHVIVRPHRFDWQPRAVPIHDGG